MTMLSFPVRAEDALFLHAQTASCPQQVGAVVLLTEPGVDLAGLRASVAARVSQLPQLRRRLIPARGRWARPRWVTDPSVDVTSRITEIICADGSLTSPEQVVGCYFAEPVDRPRRPGSYCSSGPSRAAPAPSWSRPTTPSVTATR